MLRKDKSWSVPEITVRLWGLSRADVKTVVGAYILFLFMQSSSSLQRLLGPLGAMLHTVAACGPSPVGHSPSRRPCPRGGEGALGDMGHCKAETSGWLF